MANAITDAAEARRKAHEDWRRDDTVRALLEERIGYVTRAQAAEDEGDEKAHGRFTSRVSQVDAELERHGAADQIPGAEAPKRRTTKKTAAGPGDGSGAGTQQD